jgi:hypothetical protein
MKRCECGTWDRNSKYFILFVCYEWTLYLERLLLSVIVLIVVAPVLPRSQGELPPARANATIYSRNKIGYRDFCAALFSYGRKLRA